MSARKEPYAEYRKRAAYIRLFAAIKPEAIPMKQWMAEEAEWDGLRSPTTIHARLTAGKYPNVKLWRFNKRVVFVERA